MKLTPDSKITQKPLGFFDGAKGYWGQIYSLESDGKGLGVTLLVEGDRSGQKTITYQVGNENFGKMVEALRAAGHDVTEKGNHVDTHAESGRIDLHRRQHQSKGVERGARPGSDRDRGAERRAGEQRGNLESERQDQQTERKQQMIDYFHVRSFCGIANAMVDLTTARVHLIKGPNASGKTSLADAIRYALVGEPGRVALKGQYRYLVKEGEKTGQVTVSLQQESGPLKLIRVVPTGEVITDPEGIRVDLPLAMPYVLDAQRLAGMKPADRRVFLRALMGVKADKKLIMARLKERECDPECITTILPMLRTSTGFEDAEKYAKKLATEARGGWKLLAGEAYGSKKAETWEPDVQPIDEDDLATKEAAVEAAEQKLDELHKQLAAVKQAEEALPCPHCGALARYVTRPNSNIHALEPFDGPPANPEQKELIIGELQRYTHNRNFASDQVRELRRRAEVFGNAAQVKENALRQHKNVERWTKMAEALGPDGIPGELLTEVLAPLNEHLRASAAATGWPQVHIAADMAITCGNRWYPLLSESERWRADAQLAEAVSTFAGLGILVLDRFDVLQPALRQPGLRWLASLQDRYTAILVFATMESEQVGLKGPVMFHQLTAGRLEGE